jgi:phosphoribosyl 1,2-cyclic phosphate phosphodiesterase
MKITFLGTGTSHGVPMVGCFCAVCTSGNPKNKRFRSSIWVETENFSFVVDTTPDFRMQCIREKITNLDAILYTHEHSDHILGLDELRRFSIMHQKRLPAYGSPEVLAYIRRMFPYALQNPAPYPGLPQVDLHVIEGPFRLGPFQVTPFRMPHGLIESLGYRFDDAAGPRFAYLTDCSEVSPTIRKSIAGVPLLILDALRKKPHPTHLSIDGALDVVKNVNPGKTFFMHIAHDLDHDEVNSELPEGVSLAYDQQVISL